eukprot:COSAG04_NODE_12885_length_630_cov_1.154426_1_plen_143_part_00
MHQRQSADLIGWVPSIEDRRLYSFVLATNAELESLLGTVDHETRTKWTQRTVLREGRLGSGAHEDSLETLSEDLLTRFEIPDTRARLLGLRELLLLGGKLTYAALSTYCTGAAVDERALGPALNRLRGRRLVHQLLRGCLAI